MNDDIVATVTGDVSLGVRLDTFPEAARARLLKSIENIVSRLGSQIRSRIPGSGKLRSEFVDRVFSDKSKVVGLIKLSAPKGSHDFAQAGALEYGAHRAAKVGSHNMRLDHVFASKLKAPITAIVAAYQRTPNIEAHRFIRDPVAQAKGDVMRELTDAVMEAGANE